MIMRPNAITRRIFMAALSLLFAMSCGGAEEAEIELVPAARLGHRGHVQVKQVEWNVTHPKMGQKVTVCKVVPEDRLYQKTLIPLAESYGMKRQLKWDANNGGSPENGSIRYKKEEGFGVMQLNPETGYKYFTLKLSDRSKRDADGDLMLNEMPSKDEAVKISLAWLKKLGIGEDLLARDPSGLGGLYVQFGGTTQTGRNRKLGREVTSQLSMRMIFPCAIGGIPAFWNGKGGCYIVELGDGGEFTRADWCVRSSAPIGEFQLLSRDELTLAIQQGFCWVEAPLKAEKIEITIVQLLAYHGRDTDKQKHFPPIWMMAAQPVGKPDDAVWLYIPALRQHRDKYPPLPAAQE